MKLISSLVALALCLSITSAFGQLGGDSSTLFDETIWNMKKRKVVMDQMDLTEAEKASFWPVYESYSRAINFIEGENLEIIIACTDKAYGLDQKDVESYSRRLLHNDLLLDRLRIQYFKKLSKALSAAQASKFMQLDANLRMMLRFEVQNKVESANEAQASIR